MTPVHCTPSAAFLLLDTTHLALVLESLLALLLECNSFHILDASFEKMGPWFQPYVLHDRREVGPFDRIRDQHLLKKITGFEGNVIGERQLGADDVFVEQVDVVPIRIRGIIVKGQVSSQHGV